MMSPLRPEALRRGHWLGDRVRGAACILWTFGTLLVMGLVLVGPSYLSCRVAHWSMVAWCRVVMGGIRRIAGIRVEVRGRVPDVPCIVAAKHQSFLDIIVLSATLPKPSFVMKKSIRWVPILNVYAERIGCIAIDRRAGREATATMLRQAVRGRAAGRQIVIFPQGTRVPPGAHTRYRGGVARLADAIRQPVVPVALNTGWVWPRAGLRRSPGLAVVAFLEPLPARLQGPALLAALEREIEAASDRLAGEAAAAMRAAG